MSVHEKEKAKMDVKGEKQRSKWCCSIVGVVIAALAIDFFMRWTGIYKAFAQEEDYALYDWFTSQDYLGFADARNVLIGDYEPVNIGDVPSNIVNPFLEYGINRVADLMHGGIVGIYAGDDVKNPYVYVLTAEHWPDSHKRYWIQRKTGDFGVLFPTDFPVADWYGIPDCEWLFRSIEYDTLFLNCTWDTVRHISSQSRIAISKYLANITPIKIDFDFKCEECEVYYYYADLRDKLGLSLKRTKVVSHYTHFGQHIKNLLLLYDVDIFDYVPAYLQRKLGITSDEVNHIQSFKVEGSIDSVSEDSKIYYHHNLQSSGMSGDVVFGKKNNMGVGIVKGCVNKYFQYPKNTIYSLQNPFVKSSMDEIEKDLNFKRQQLKARKDKKKKKQKKQKKKEQKKQSKQSSPDTDSPKQEM